MMTVLRLGLPNSGMWMEEASPPPWPPAPPAPPPKPEPPKGESPEPPNPPKPPNGLNGFSPRLPDFALAGRRPWPRNELDELSEAELAVEVEAEDEPEPAEPAEVEPELAELPEPEAPPAEPPTPDVSMPDCFRASNNDSNPDVCFMASTFPSRYKRVPTIAPHHTRKRP